MDKEAWRIHTGKYDTGVKRDGPWWDKMNFKIIAGERSQTQEKICSKTVLTHNARKCKLT